MAESDVNAFGRAVARLRLARGYGQKDVADRVRSYYADAGAYGRIERGERRPGRDAAVAILVRGLLIHDVELINQTLQLGEYGPLRPGEIESIGLSSPVEPVVPSEQSVLQPEESWLSWQAAGVMVGSSALVSLAGFLIRDNALFAVSASCLYAALYVVSLYLETAFAPQVPARIAARTFGIVAITSMAALVACGLLVQSSSRFALLISFAVFVLGAVAQFAFVRNALPEKVIVQATFQAQTAQAAHLKNTGYFFLIVVLYWLPSFHCISTLFRETRAGQTSWVHEVAGHDFLSGRGILALSPRLLLGLLLLKALIALLMGSRLLDSLRPHDRLNSFTLLFYLRAILYFVLCLICIGWFAYSLSELR